VFDSLGQFLSIHVEPHPDNHTVLRFDDAEEIRCGEAGLVYTLGDGADVLTGQFRLGR
jgi:hypothetical protein